MFGIRKLKSQVAELQKALHELSEEWAMERHPNPYPIGTLAYFYVNGTNLGKVRILDWRRTVENSKLSPYRYSVTYLYTVRLLKNERVLVNWDQSHLMPIEPESPPPLPKKASVKKGRKIRK